LGSQADKALFPALIDAYIILADALGIQEALAAITYLKLVSNVMAALVA
jgi:hypothetical protein